MEKWGGALPKILFAVAAISVSAAMAPELLRRSQASVQVQAVAPAAAAGGRRRGG